MNKLISVNPTNGSVIKEHFELNDFELDQKINFSDKAFKYWRLTKIESKISLFEKLAYLLETKKQELAKLITLEMGKVYTQSIAEIDKCIQLIKYYITEGPNLIKDEYFKTTYAESYVKFEPIGVILAIMPWNFPFWQVIRAAIPNLFIGNVILLKHASNVQICASEIENLFYEAGFPDFVFQNLSITSQKVELVISNSIVKGVTLTGSDKTGSVVGALAGREIKKVVMELGGSDPFLILNDLEELVPICRYAVNARIRNAGQACTSPKRFIVMNEIYDQFLEVYTQLFKSLRVGNPMEDDVDIGPLVSQQALDYSLNQINESVSKGANLILGGKEIKREGYFLEPTILTEIKSDMPVYYEEVFAPIAIFIKVNSLEEMIETANDTKYGLTASIWTKNLNLAKELIDKLEVGSVYINSVPSSDPAMPFGGIKKSGFGRELSKYGLLEFANIKSVFIR